MEVTVFVIGSLVAFVVNISLAIFVYLKNKKVAKNRLFSLLCVTIGMWCLYPTIMTSNLDLRSKLFLTRIIYLFAIFSPTVYLHFVLEFLSDVGRKKLTLFLTYIFSIVFAFLSFSDLFIAGLTPSDIYRFTIVPGPLYAVYVGVFAVMCVYGFYKVGK